MKLFRRRFRMPYQAWQDLVDDCRKSELFERWNDSTDAIGLSCTSLELLVLGTLRYLGRGWTFDDIAEATGVSEEMHRQFFHLFVTYGSTEFYEKNVSMPASYEDVANFSSEFEKAGMPGAIGSTDAVNIVMEKCSWRMRQTHIGFKQAFTARTYNVTVNHRRQILYCTAGHPARWNDKTIIRFDDFVTSLRDGSRLGNFDFVLLEHAPDGTIIKQKYRGCWVLVDNGYLKWSVTIPPFKTTISIEELRFSEWLESMRKDVECCFGILKARWRILKTGIRLHGIDVCDKIFKTCCALHNFLLQVDGLHEKWEDGVTCSYENAHYANFDMNEDDIPASVREMYAANGVSVNTVDHSSTGNRIARGDDVEDDYGDEEEKDSLCSSTMEGDSDLDDDEEEVVVQTSNTTGGVRIVRNLPRDFFRSKLVEHFNIKFHQNEIIWPRRNRVSRPLV
eukprot:CAMPEP_0196815854 /NCGR_PEP_ID=MMETSP1362-20130617/52339_1 /TAXON_ID=163516 /ORGANISM="Leptocylindrus danicus, Strain CCMP1856" /LENGTH=449 /DNA_ID=CAMNT_0042192989 /DNA_START=265 /DNA_END=1614 /DNA_ORIENTATION=-